MRKELTGVKDNNEHINMNKNGEMKNERNATKLQQMVRIELSLVGGEKAIFHAQNRFVIEWSW